MGWKLIEKGKPNALGVFGSFPCLPCTKMEVWLSSHRTNNKSCSKIFFTIKGLRHGRKIPYSRRYRKLSYRTAARRHPDPRDRCLCMLRRVLASPAIADRFPPPRPALFEHHRNFSGLGNIRILQRIAFAQAAPPVDRIGRDLRDLAPARDRSHFRPYQ
jgi:hypothetical protein